MGSAARVKRNYREEGGVIQICKKKYPKVGIRKTQVGCVLKNKEQWRNGNVFESNKSKTIIMIHTGAPRISEVNKAGT
jgi:hypothetical protein